jgi:hypothetical protein
MKVQMPFYCRQDGSISEDEQSSIFQLKSDTLFPFFSQGAEQMRLFRSLTPIQGLAVLGLTQILSACNQSDNSGLLNSVAQAANEDRSPSQSTPSQTAPNPESTFPPVTINPTQDDTSIFLSRSFQEQGKKWVPADFKTMNLKWEFDVSQKQARGTANIRFQTAEQGIPFFLMTPEVQSAKLDGQTITIQSTQDPDRATPLKYVDANLAPGTDHTLEIQYEIPSDEVTFDSTGMAFVTAMADITDGNFFESYGPSNFEFDQFKMSLEMNILGGSDSHQLFTNGSAALAGENQWKVEFPDFYNTSSFFVHLTQTEMSVRKMTYQGLTHEIPITIYSQDASLTSQAANKVLGLFKELEGTFGPYMHPAFTAYISGSGGMEHAGATITSLSALGHELTHSWFARGVMPADGRSGWIDEGIANWRDTGYPRGSASMTRSSTNVGNFSIYSLFTPYNAYADGSAIMGDLDGLFASDFGGLRPVLKDFFAAAKGTLVTSEIFKNYLQFRTGIDLKNLFTKYAYGNKQLEILPIATGEAGEGHPTPLTRSEMRYLR